MRLFSDTGKFLRRLGGQHTSSPRLVAACVVGASVGCTPLFGAHLPICIALAALLRLNHVVVYGAAQISIPPLAPFVGLTCIEAGSLVLHHRSTFVALASLREVRPWSLAGDLLVCWMIGAPIVGTVVGLLLGGIIVWLTSRRSSRPQDAFTRARADLERRFSGAPRGIRQYVHWKLRLDPVYRVVCDELPDAITIVDLGTGLGIFPMMLSLLGTGRRIHGIDYDAGKIDLAIRASRALSCSFEMADIVAWTPPPCDVILLIDVLHYLPPDAQREVLKRARDVLERASQPSSRGQTPVDFAPRLLVRDGDRQARHGAWTRFVEKVALKMGWNRGQTTWFRTVDELLAELRELGFTCEHVLVAGPLHPGNVLIRASLPSPSPDVRSVRVEESAGSAIDVLARREDRP